MDIKKIIVCVFSFVYMTSVANAAIDTSLEGQMKQSRVNLQDVSELHTPKAEKLKPQFIACQKRIMDYNGLIMTNSFTSTYDYKTKVRPLFISSGDFFGTSYGFGYISVNKKEIDLIGSLDNRDWDSFFNQCVVGETIAHEIGHATLGHHISNYTKDEEEHQAEQEAVRLISNLPEGGLGYWAVAINRKKTDSDADIKYKEMANNRFRMDYAGKFYYIGSDGKEYEIKGNPYRKDKSIYLGGQIGYCMAMGAFSVDNLEIARGKTLKDFPMDGYFLICRSSKLPNGYKVLADVTSIVQEMGNDLYQELEVVKEIFKKHSISKNYEYAQIYVEGINVDRTIILETMAFAIDYNK